MKRVIFSENVSINTNVSNRFDSNKELHPVNSLNDGRIFNNNNEERETGYVFNKCFSNKMINDSFGQLSDNFLDKKQSKSRRILNSNSRFRKQSNLCQSLPALSLPGSNMSNSLNPISSDPIANQSIEPLSNAEELIILNPMNRPYDGNYQKIRFMFSLSTFLSFTIILFELGAIAVGVVFTNTCELVDIYLIVSGCFHSLIIILEWTKSWIWIQSSNPVVPDSNSDHMQLFVSCILMMLYCVSLVWFTVGFAWIPNVFVLPLSNETPKVKEVVIIQNNKTYTQIIPVCTEGFYIYAICYQVVVAILFLIRIIMCCLSHFCKSLCTKFVTHTSPGSCESHLTNPLHDLLPPMRGPLYRWGFQNEGHASGINALYNSGQLCMITPIPFYPSDRKAAETIPVPQF